MKLVVCQETKAFVAKTNAWCREKFSSTGAKKIWLPAGGTPLPVYESWQAEKPDFLAGVDLIPLDDVVTGTKQGIFKQYFEENLGKFTSQFRWLDLNGNFALADLAILGLGKNGHLAFHEPGVPLDFQYGRVALSPGTCKEIDVEPGSEGITHGVASLLRAKAILLLVTGAKKKAVLQQLLATNPQEISADFPASVLRSHPDVTILCDESAVSAKRSVRR